MTELLHLTPQEWKNIYVQELKDLTLWMQQATDATSFEAALEVRNDELLAHEQLPASQREAALVIKSMLSHSRIAYLEASEETTIALRPFAMLWEAFRSDMEANHSDFYQELYFLFLQWNGAVLKPATDSLAASMQKWPSGLDKQVQAIRQQNKERIIGHLITDISDTSSRFSKSRYRFESGWSYEQRYEAVLEWWLDHRFHLVMAIKRPDRLNRYLGYTLSAEVIDRLERAKEKGIPFFVTPYYLALLDITGRGYDDLAIRDYIIYSEELIENFGSIKAWEREDVVQAGQANAAGWILPHSHAVHRRYPEVAILIPDTMGRACGGLCASCQRMYGFQKGNLNFDLEALKPQVGWRENLRTCLDYFEHDAQLRDILITGGDALMSQNKTLQIVLDEVCEMVARKEAANAQRKYGEKYASISRIRLGSRLPAYLPSRINEGLVQILKSFRERAQHLGVSQFIIQTHFQSPLEMTPTAAAGIAKLIDAGWIVVNQLVFTQPASRRGHIARLRQVLNEAGVLCYYTFSVKGFDENKALFVPNARSVQEQVEEKRAGVLTAKQAEALQALLYHPDNRIAQIRAFMKANKLPFLATDRSVMNLPGIGKSMSFEMVGLDAQGRRILGFAHDKTRRHSPVIEQVPTVYIRERKSIAEYLRELESSGEHLEAYRSIWSYRTAQTESRFRFYEYPDAGDALTSEVTNLSIN